MTSAACKWIATTKASPTARWIAFSACDDIRRLRRSCFGIAFGEADPPKVDITLRRRRRRRCRRSGRAELDCGCPLRAGLCPEIWPIRKTKCAGDEICRETAHRHAVVLHRLVEVTPLDRD